MEKTRKHLKTSSLIVLLFAGLSLFQIVSELMFGELNTAEIPTGAPDNILLITKMFLLGLSAVFLLPQVYVGVKGLRMAKTPDASKGHIVWAFILCGLAALNLISAVVGMVQGTGSDNLENLSSALLELAIYYDFIKYAKVVRKEAGQPAE